MRSIASLLKQGKILECLGMEVPDTLYWLLEAGFWIKYLASGIKNLASRIQYLTTKEIWNIICC